MRVQTRWDGFNGAPGFTVMHFRDFDTDTAPTIAQATAALDRVRLFFETVKSQIPSACRVTVQPVVDVIEHTDGSLVDSLNVTSSPAAITGTSAGTVAGPAGAVFNWRTNTIRNGRRVRGRTFLVPLGATAYEANGTLSAAALTSFNTAATALVDSTGTPDLFVYGRPSAPQATDGVIAVVSSYTIPDMVAVLRSRRD